MQIDQSGQWGDTFGAFNALFGALGFTAVFSTLLIQGSAIRRQQEDQVRQRFDENFFRLLSLLREVRGELVYTRTRVAKATPSEGYLALKDAANDAIEYIHDASRSDGAPLLKSRVAEEYHSKVHLRAEHGLGPYFRLIYTILRRIDDDGSLSPSDRITYANILRGQLGSPEVALLALNGLTVQSADLSHYLIKYRMLKYIAQTPVRNLLANYYPMESFEGRDD